MSFDDKTYDSYVNSVVERNSKRWERKRDVYVALGYTPAKAEEIATRELRSRDMDSFVAVLRFVFLHTVPTRGDKRYNDIYREIVSAHQQLGMKLEDAIDTALERNKDLFKDITFTRK